MITGTGPDPAKVRQLIAEVCEDIATFLIEKNRAYGNSALNPVRIFAKDVDPMAQLDVRIDDKLNRVIQGSGYPGDDDEKDLLGYLVLKQVARRILAAELPLL